MQIFEGKIKLWDLTRACYTRPPVEYYRLLGKGKEGWSGLPSNTPVMRQLLDEMYGDSTAMFYVLEAWSRIKSSALANKARDDHEGAQESTREKGGG